MGAAWHLPVADLRSRLADASGRYLQPFTHGSLRCVLYAPDGSDQQTPHRQDELYVVTRGEGRFDRAGETVAFAPGDAMFVPAGAAHRFVEVTPDFECWAIFWGPPGGESDGNVGA